MLSRNKVTSTNKINSAEEQSLMKKLNKRKIRWIVLEVERRETGVYTIARTQDITPRHTRRVAKKYRNNKYSALKKCGRKPIVISDEKRKLVKNTYEEYLVGATMIEQILDEKGIHLNHNRIHRIMLETSIAKKELNKSRRRSWVRYERKYIQSYKDVRHCVPYLRTNYYLGQSATSYLILSRTPRQRRGA